MSIVNRVRKLNLHIDGAKRSALDKAHGRIVILSLGFALLYFTVAARVVDLTILQGELPRITGTTTERAHEPEQKKSVIRADIVDRNGVLLATSLETASLYADPAEISDPVRAATALSKAIPGITYGDALEKLQRKNRFVWIKRNLTPEEQSRILQLGEPGLKFQTEYTRIYPQGELTAHMVGYGSVDGQGLSGVERSFDDLLSKGGKPLALTLDVRLQHILRRETKKAIRDFTAKGGAGIIMDVVTGEILAATSLPDFDPQNPSAASKAQMFNNVTLGVYEPGSTMKIFSTAALLEHKKPHLGMTFETTKPLKVGRFTIRDFHPEPHPLNIPEVFMHSSNIGSALMGQMVGGKGLRDFYNDLGLLSATTLEISEKGKPIVPASPWREITTLTASYGHGVSVAPINVVAAAATIVRGGTVVKPTIILDEALAKGAKRIVSDDEVRVVSPQTSHRIRQMMRLVVTQGTAKFANVAGYNVGGKTGTAQKNINGRYDNNKRISSFMAFFPMEAPRYAVFVMVDEPVGNKKSYGYATAGWVAVPAVGRVIEAMAPLLGIKPKHTAEENDIAYPLLPYIKKKGGQNASVTTD